MLSKKKKNGRPKTIKGLTRVSLSLSASEKTELKKQANESGCSISEYLRKLIKDNKEGK